MSAEGGRSAAEPTDEVILEAAGIRKSFNKVEVLHGVDFGLRRGEVHGLVGQNGAGKSTLMKILNGVYARDEGSIRVGGREATYTTPEGAREHGIAMVFQEFSLVPTMSVAENIFLTREPRAFGGLTDDREARRRAAALFADLDVAIDPAETVERLPVGSRQLVEIAKALSQETAILILDEPTASLSHAEIQTLFTIVRRLAERGISVVFISHHLQELSEVCDRVTVLRDGNVVLSDALANLQLRDIITAMVGRTVESLEAPAARTIDRSRTPLLEVEGLRSGERVNDVSFRLHRGEVLGIAGLLGSGRTELVMSLLGLRRRQAGSIRVDGREVRIGHSSDAIRLGLTLVPEDRRREGMIRGQSIRMNVLLPIWRRFARLGLIDDRRGAETAAQLVEQLRIRTTGIEQFVERLSGGNQQKVVIAKSLSSQPRILILDDPTVGIDVQSKREIMEAVRRLADEGNGVILISSELEDIAAVADRVLVLRRGAIAAEFERARGDEISEATLLAAIQHERA